MQENKPENFTRTHRLAAILFLFIAVVAVYLKTVDYPFLWDDTFLISDNVFLRNPHNIIHVFDRQYFSQTYELSYRPITTLSFFLNFAISGLDPKIYHLTNIIIHFVNVMLVMAIIARLVGNSRLGVGFALLFALHPIHTEALNGVSFREDPLCLLFIAAAFIFHMRFRDKEEEKRKKVNFAWSMFFFTLALFTKETAVVYPGVMVIYDMFIGNKKGERVKWLGPALIAALPLIFFLFIRFGPLKGPGESYIYHGGKPIYTLYMMVQAIAHYLNLVVWPLRQCVDYVFKEHPKFTDGAVMGSFFLLIACGAGAVMFISIRRQIAIGVAWFLLFLLPVSNIIPIGVVMAERYLYIPCLGIFIIASYVAHECFIADDRPVKFLNGRILTVLIVALAVGAGYMTSNRNDVWADPVVFWENACECAPPSATAAVNLGLAYMNEKRYDEAGDSLVRAAFLSSSGNLHDIRYGVLYRAFTNLGIICGYQNQNEKAIVFFKQASKLNPGNPQPYLNLGMSYINLGMLNEAQKYLEKGIAISPTNVSARVMLAMVYTNTDQRNKAIQQCETVLKLDPTERRAKLLLQRIYEFDRIRLERKLNSRLKLND